MKADISTAAWIRENADRSEALRVEVRDNGDIAIKQGKDLILIEGRNVAQAFWLSDALHQAGELSKKRPLSK